MIEQSPIEVRPLRLDDQDMLTDFCHRREYPESSFASSELLKQSALAAVSNSLDELVSIDKAHALVAQDGDRIVGYSICQTETIESITRERQTLVADFAAETESAFQELIRAQGELGKSRGDKYLVVYFFESQTMESQWARDYGLHEELVRYFLSASPDEVFDEHPGYKFRKAKEQDLLFIMNVVATHSPAYVPANREVDELRIRQAFLGAYTDLGTQNKKRVPMVLESRATGELAGYIIVEPQRMYGDSGPLGLYVYDISVAAKPKEKGLGLYLLRGSQKLLTKMGGGFLFGDVSADNHRGLRAFGKIGCRIDSRRWGLAL